MPTTTSPRLRALDEVLAGLGRRHARTAPVAAGRGGQDRIRFPWLRRTARPPPTSQATAAPRGHVEHPIHGGAVGWVLLRRPSAASRRTARRASGSGRGGQGRARRSGRSPRPAPRAGRRRPGAARPGGPAPGRRRARPRRRAAAAARGAPGCGGARGRRCSGRARVRGRAAAQAVRCRIGAGDGSVGGRGSNPASPSSPAPRSRLSSTVSARSSAVWPSSAPARERRVAGGAGPRLEVRARATWTRTDRNAAPKRCAAAATTAASSAEPGPQPVVDVDRGGRAARRRRRARAGPASRAPRRRRS